MSRLSTTITVIGAVPFVGLSIAVSMHAFQEARPVVEMLLTYAAVILSFLGGIHWGIAVQQFGKNRQAANFHIAEGIFPSIVGWSVLAYPDVHLQLLVLTLLYAFMWAVDSLIYTRDMIPQWFFSLRCVVTPIVIVSLYVAYFGLI